MNPKPWKKGSSLLTYRQVNCGHNSFAAILKAQVMMLGPGGGGRGGGGGGGGILGTLTLWEVIHSPPPTFSRQCLVSFIIKFREWQVCNSCDAYMYLPKKFEYLTPYVWERKREGEHEYFGGQDIPKREGIIHSCIHGRL